MPEGPHDATGALAPEPGAGREGVGPTTGPTTGWPSSIGAHAEAARRLDAVLAASAAALPHDGRLPAPFLDAVRARVAAMATGRPLPEVAAGSELERAVLAYAEALTIDPHGVTDADVATLNAHLAPGEVVALTVDIGMADGAARLAALLAGATPTSRSPA